MQEIPLLLYYKPVFSNEKIKYIAKIRSIIYAMVKTKTNILFAMLIVSRFAKNPRSDLIFSRKSKKRN